MAKVADDYQARIDAWVSERKGSVRMQFVLTFVCALFALVATLAFSALPVWHGVPLGVLAFLFLAVFVASVVHGWWLLLETII